MIMRPGYFVKIEQGNKPALVERLRIPLTGSYDTTFLCACFPATTWGGSYPHLVLYNGHIFWFHANYDNEGRIGLYERFPGASLMATTLVAEMLPWHRLLGEYILDPRLGHGKVARVYDENPYAGADFSKVPLKMLDLKYPQGKFRDYEVTLPELFSAREKMMDKYE